MPKLSAAELLETARRHMCAIDEIVDRMYGTSESEAANIRVRAREYFHAVDDIMDQLDRLEAGAEKEALARELREQAAGLRRVVTLLDLDYPPGRGGHC
jgi:hypothetical protein